MKKIIGIFIFIICTSSIFSQKTHYYKYKPVTYNPNSGYMNINELNFGFAMGDSSSYGAQNFYGFTSVHGYQLNIVNMNFKSSLQAGIGSGVLFYDGEPRIPLYLDVRFMLDMYSISPFVYNDCGLIFKYGDFYQTKLFLNPGAGVKFKVSRSFAVTMGAGLFVQMGNMVFRESFFSFKTGLIYKLKQ